MSLARGGSPVFAGSGGGSVTTVSLAVTAGDTVIGFMREAVAVTGTATLDGVAMTRIKTSSTYNFGTYNSAVFIGTAGATGTSAIVFTYGSAATYPCGACSYRGAGSSPEQTPVTNNSASPMTLTVTTVAADAWLIVLAFSTSGTPGASTGLTSFGVGGNNSGVFDSGDLVTPGSHSGTFTYTGTAAGIAFSLAPAGGAGGGSLPFKSRIISQAVMRASSW